MEKVLYDLYLAEAEISANNTTFSSDSARKQELLNSVLKKHKITEAVLDTSLAWYSGHLEKYFIINENLNKRFAQMGETLRKQEGMAVKPITATLLPTEKDRILLRAIDLRQKAYSFKADTTLNAYGGFYDLQFNVLGISASQRPVVTLCVQCIDTVFVKRDTITANGSFMTSVEVKQGKQAKRLYGSIYFPEVNSYTTVFIYNFTLMHSFNARPQVKNK